MANVQISDLDITIQLTNPNDLIHIKSNSDGIDRAIAWENFTLHPDSAIAQAVVNLGEVATEDVVPIFKGGTGATTAANARTNLGLGNLTTVTATTFGVDWVQLANSSSARATLGLGTSDDVTFGTVTASSVNTTTSSDIRLKDDVRLVNIDWDLYDEMDFVTGVYNSSAKPNDVNTRFFGVIAQNAIKVFPWCCGKDERGYLYVDYFKLSLAVALAEKEYPIWRKLFVRPFKRLMKLISK